MDNEELNLFINLLLSDNEDDKLVAINLVNGHILKELDLGYLITIIANKLEEAQYSPYIYDKWFKNWDNFKEVFINYDLLPMLDEFIKNEWNTGKYARSLLTTNGTIPENDG